MKKNQISRKEIRHKANMWLIANIFSIIISIVIGFIFVKLIITFYGESSNGMMRFINQIVAYVSSVSTGFFIIFTIKIIKSFKTNQIDKILFYASKLSYLIKKISVWYFFISVSISVFFSYYFKTESMSFLFLFSLSFSIILPNFLTFFFLMKNNILLSASNHGYIVSIIDGILKILFFLFAIYFMLFNTPQLTQKFIGKTSVLVFDSSATTISKYSLIFGLGFYGLEPLIAYFFYNRFAKKLFPNTTMYIPKDKNEIKLINSELRKGMLESLSLNIIYILLYNTDEFAISLLKKTENVNIVLQKITLYGLYFSLIWSIGNIILQYINSKQMILGSHVTSANEYKKEIQKIKSNVLIMIGLFLVVGIFLIPTLVLFLFQQPKGISYFNINFALPLLLVCTLFILNSVVKLEFQLSNKLKLNMIIYSMEATINLVLSFSLVLYFGIYWVLWSSVVAAVIKMIVFEIIILKQSEYYTSHFYSYKKKFILFMIMIGIFSLEVGLFYALDVAYLLNKLKKHVYWFEMALILVLYTVHVKWLLSIKNKKELKLIQKKSSNVTPNFITWL